MNSSSSADFSTILNRILDTAADNLRIAKILIQMGLDPDKLTYFYGGLNQKLVGVESAEPIRKII